MKDFIERYRENTSESYSYEDFLSDVLANSSGLSDWLTIYYPVGKYNTGSLEGNIARSIRNGECVFEEDVDDRKYKPTLDSWRELIESGNEDVDECLDMYLDECDDAYTAYSLLQLWVFGEIILG